MGSKMNWQGKKVLVVGLGKSGRAAAVELSRLGALVTACDHQPLTEDRLENLKQAGVKLFLGGYPAVSSINPQLLITSPGVPPEEPPLVAAQKLAIPIWGELELAYRLMPSDVKIVAITGTNGKTTTTALCGRMFKNAGLVTIIAGNIGIPLVKKAKEIAPGNYIICEVSSFQLETASFFHPQVAIILNITPDHLDRHGSLGAYIAAKEKLIARQGAKDYTILNYDDPILKKIASRSKGQVLFFSRRQPLEQGAYLLGGNIYVNLGDREIRLCHQEELALKGKHNLENCLAASLGAAVMGVPATQIVRTLKDFSGLPHRLEAVAKIKDVLYINDSKGTNPEASIMAIDSYPNPLVLIAGGRKKGSEFTHLAHKMLGRVKHLILLGEAAGEIETEARAAGIKSIYQAGNMEEAVTEAAKVADPGDIVMLSPACTSWDMFESYEQRGEIFKNLVLGLEDKKQALGG